MQPLASRSLPLTADRKPVTDDWIAPDASGEDRVRVATLEEVDKLWAHFAVVDLAADGDAHDIRCIAVARVVDVPETAEVGDVFGVVPAETGEVVASSWTGRYGDDGWTSQSPRIGLDADAVDETHRDAARRWRTERDADLGKPPIE